LQCTHEPPPSHSSPVPQAVPAGDTPCWTTPAAQPSVVHALPSSGTSLSSATISTSPAPSHCAVRQSPAVWLATAVPAAPHVSEQTWSVHVFIAHGLSAPGQSVGSLHSSDCG